MPVAALAKFFDPRLAYIHPLFQLSSRPKVKNLARGDFRSFSNEDFLSLRFSVSSAGSFVRGLASRAASNGEWGLTIPSLQCLLVGTSFGDSPRAPKAMGQWVL